VFLSDDTKVQLIASAACALMEVAPAKGTQLEPCECNDIWHRRPQLPYVPKVGETAAVTASNRASALNGFNRHRTAPCSMRRPCNASSL